MTYLYPTMFYKNHTLQCVVKELKTSGTVSGGSGVATFDLTDDSGNAIFTDVFQESANFWVNSNVSYNFSSWTLSGDKKTLTVKVTYPSISALVLIYGNAANGTTVYLQLMGA